MFNKLKGLSEDASVPLGRERKATTKRKGRTWEGKRIWERGEGNMI